MMLQSDGSRWGGEGALAMALSSPVRCNIPLGCLSEQVGAVTKQLLCFLHTLIDRLFD